MNALIILSVFIALIVILALLIKFVLPGLLKKLTDKLFGGLFNGLEMHQKLLDREKEIYLRHKNNEFSDFENNTVRRLLSEDIFPCYYFMCPTENIWNELDTRISSDEKIISLSASHNINFEDYSYESKSAENSPVLAFQTNKNRILLYKINPQKIYELETEFFESIYYSDIESIDYIIRHEMMGIYKYSIPVEAIIKLKNGNEVLFPSSTVILENIIDKIMPLTIDDVGAYMNRDLQKEKLDRITAKLNELLQSEKIPEYVYNTLISRADTSLKEIYDLLYKEKVSLYEQSNASELNEEDAII